MQELRRFLNRGDQILDILFNSEITVNTLRIACDESNVLYIEYVVVKNAAADWFESPEETYYKKHRIAMIYVYVSHVQKTLRELIQKEQELLRLKTLLATVEEERLQARGTMRINEDLETTLMI